TIDGVGAEMVVLSARIHEHLSQPTRATVVFVSPEDIDGSSLPGVHAVIRGEVEAQGARSFHLLVVGFTFAGVHAGSRRRYQVHRLTVRPDVRIFQDKDAKEIVAAVLDGAGVPGDHVRFSLQSPPPKRTYTVQYRELDFDFASRLLEHEGIFYFVVDGDDHPV